MKAIPNDLLQDLNVRNNRNWKKGSVDNIVLGYVGDNKKRSFFNVKFPLEWSKYFKYESSSGIHYYVVVTRVKERLFLVKIVSCKVTPVEVRFSHHESTGVATLNSEQMKFNCFYWNIVDFSTFYAKHSIDEMGRGDYESIFNLFLQNLASNPNYSNYSHSFYNLINFEQ